MTTDTLDRELTITRTFDAPRELVWQVFTQPEHWPHWVGGGGHPCAQADIDLRPGGKWRALLRAPDGSERVQSGVYREVDAPRRLVFTFHWGEDVTADTPETVITVMFTEQHGKTLMHFHQGIFNSTPNRDGHIRGWTGAFDKLAAYIAQQHR